MAVFCPKHHIQLEIKKTHFTIPKNPTIAVVGSCPMCNLKYINRNLFGNAKTTIAGERYEYLKDLAIMFPFDEREELQLRTQEEARRRKQEEKEKKELARQEQLRKQEEKAKRRAQQKELERIKREKALEQKQKIKRRTDEAIKRAKELKFQEKKNEYINNPNTPFQVAQIAYFNPIPPICPYDEEALIYATNIQQQSQNAGYVCIRCGRLFLDKIKSKETAAKRRQGKKLDITFPETLHGKNGLISAINPKTFEHAYTRETLVWVAICNALRKGKRLPLKSGNLANLLPPKQISQYFSLRGTCVSLAMRYCNEVTNRTEIQLEFEKAFHNYSAVVAGKRNLPDYYTFGLLQEISGLNDTTREQCEQILEQRLMLPILKSYYKYQHEQNIQAAKQNSIKLPKKISEIPKSTILEVSLSAKLVGKIGCVAIVANQLDQAAESGIFWVGRTFASMILAAIQIDPDRQFNYKGIEYQIDSIVEYSESKKYFGIISRFCNPTSPQTVFVFSQKNIEHYKGDDYEEVTAMIPCANSRFPAPVSVVYERKTQTYFINEASYDIARARYGLPYLMLREIEVETSKHGFGQLRAQSMLNRLGYNVNATENLSVEARRKILRYAIDTGTLSKVEVINHLEWLINTRQSMDNMENAVGEWKIDLQFVSSYQIDKQRSIWAKTFTPKYPR